MYVARRFIGYPLGRGSKPKKEDAGLVTKVGRIGVSLLSGGDTCRMG
jgi:hypothetical protein